MNAGRVLLVACLPALSAAGAADPPPGDFKFFARFYGAGDEPVSRSEVVSSKGKVYQFPDEADEFLVYDPAERSCCLVDRRRKIFARVAADRLDASMATLKKKLGEVVDRKEASKDRGDRVSARMYRDLIDPKFAADFDAASGRLTLSNGSVRVDAQGTAGADPAHLALLRDSTAAFVKLGALRDSDSIPPFTRLDALEALYSRKLLPAETTFVYRLAGPPIKYRWMYLPESPLNDDDKVAMSRVERAWAGMKQVAFAEYEKE